MNLINGDILNLVGLKLTWCIHHSYLYSNTFLYYVSYNLVIYNDKDFAFEETKKFNDYLKLFSHFTGDEEPEETYPLDDKDIPIDSIDSIIKAEN